MSLKYVITGTGGCGTAWLTNVFNNAGYQAGHERIFNALDIKKNLVPKIDIEISYAAAPHLGGLDGIIDGNTKVIHLVRNPYEVVRTWIAKSGRRNYFHGKGAHPEFVRKYLPDIADIESPVDAGIYYYIGWNKLVDPYRDELVRLEEISIWLQNSFKPEVMKESMVHFATTTPKVNIGTNSRYFVIDFTKASSFLYTQLLDMAADYGYQII
jgi:hypothetical protein